MDLTRGLAEGRIPVTEALVESADTCSQKLAYFGWSSGGSRGAMIPAVEDRLKASILAVGGLSGAGRPEVRDINYVGRVRVPTLMLNGRYDLLSPYEASAKPFFDLLASLIGVSITRCSPNCSYSPRVTPYAPPLSVRSSHW